HADGAAAAASNLVNQAPETKAAAAAAGVARPLPPGTPGGVKPMSNMALLEENDDARYSSDHLRRQVNWILGVNPQDVRFPVNIAELAFTANYFAALTADKIKIFINKRVPEEKNNCKKKTIEFDVDHRPRGIVSYDNRDNLCVVFQSKIEFYSLATMDKVGVYQTSLGEIVTTVTAFKPDSAWRSLDSRKPMSVGRQSTFTFWNEQVMVPQQVIFLGITGFNKTEKYLSFHWSSPTTILLISKAPTRSAAPAVVAVAPPRCRTNPNGKPLVFCSYDTANRKILNKFSKHNVQRSEHYSLSPDGKLLFVSSRTKCILVDTITLKQLHSLERLPRPTSGLQKSAGPVWWEHAISSAGDLIVLNRQSMTIEFYPNFESLSSLANPRTFDVSKCPHLPVGSLGVLFVFKHDGHEEGDQPKHYSSYSVVLLISMEGHVLLRAEWPRAYVHLVTEEMLVYLQYLSTKPFSAAHACIFDFNMPVTKKSFWSRQGLGEAGH
uniref:ANAPC4_WD40 domain-containing protein n=1 Tax=Macrostomum lignano TaxID=282301 RepID=A0A1I8JFL7_9PLAT